MCVQFDNLARYFLVKFHLLVTSYISVYCDNYAYLYVALFFYITMQFPRSLPASLCMVREVNRACNGADMLPQYFGETRPHRVLFVHEMIDENLMKICSVAKSCGDAQFIRNRFTQSFLRSTDQKKNMSLCAFLSLPKEVVFIKICSVFLNYLES